MWQPGEDKPADESMDIGDAKGEEEDPMDEDEEKQESSNREENTPSKGRKMESSKALSGATMNMRFMQRKEERRKSEADANRSTPLMTPNQPQHEVDTVEGEDVDETVRYQVADSVDLYGSQVHVLGRRSFGGFHRTIEDAWSRSKSSHSADPNKRSKKVSDDELLKRYEDYVKGGRRREGDASRPVGNLQKKRKSTSPSPQNRKQKNQR